MRICSNRRSRSSPTLPSGCRKKSFPLRLPQRPDESFRNFKLFFILRNRFYFLFFIIRDKIPYELITDVFLSKIVCTNAVQYIIL